MRVRTTKATWFVFVGCALAQLPLACRRGSGGAEAAVCADDGIVSSRRETQPNGAELAAETVQISCRSCGPSARPGAAPGSECSAASVCSEFCCECPNTSPKLGYRARVCDSGRCADAKSACISARSTIHPDVCEHL